MWNSFNIDVVLWSFLCLFLCTELTIMGLFKQNKTFEEVASVNMQNCTYQLRIHVFFN